MKAGCRPCANLKQAYQFNDHSESSEFISVSALASFDISPRLQAARLTPSLSCLPERKLCVCLYVCTEGRDSHFTDWHFLSAFSVYGLEPFCTQTTTTTAITTTAITATTKHLRTGEMAQWLSSITALVRPGLFSQQPQGGSQSSVPPVLGDLVLIPEGPRSTCRAYIRTCRHV